MSPKWKRILRNVAPALSAAFGGPLAGIAAKAVANELLPPEQRDSDNLEAEALAAIERATPADLVKLREIDKNFESEMRRLNIDVFRLEVEDRQSARSMASTQMWPQITLSSIFVVGYFVILWFVFTHLQSSMPKEIMALASALLGVMTGEFPRIMAFWFGSSVGSKEKTKLLNGKPLA